MDGNRESGFHVPLAVAAASALCWAQGAVSNEEYEMALNLAAAALSRLLPIYTVDAKSPRLVRAEIDVGSGRFRDGATLYEHSDGTRVMPLFVTRNEVAAAVELVRDAALPFDLLNGRP